MRKPSPPREPENMDDALFDARPFLDALAQIMNRIMREGQPRPHDDDRQR